MNPADSTTSDPVPADPRSDAAFLAAVLEQGSDIVVAIDAEVRLLYANHTAETVLGLTRDALIATNVLDLVHPDDLGLAVESLGGTTVTGPGRKIPIELRVRHADGSWRRLEMVATNLLDDPAVHAIVLGARDVTDRPEIEARLRTFEARFEAAFDHAPVGRALLDADGRLQRVNQRFCDLVEQRPQDLVMMRLAELFPDCPELAIPDSDGSIDDVSVESRIGRTDGASAWLKITVAPVRDEDSTVRTYSVFVNDVTDLRAAEAELRRAEAEFRALVENSSDIITVLEPDGSWRSSSAAGTRLLGYEEGINPEGGIFSLLHPDDVELATTTFGKVMEGTHPADEPIVLRVQSADGSRWLHLETVARNLVDDPAVRGIVLNSRDVTERVAAEEALHASQGRFRSLVLHASDLITVVDAEANLQYVSPSVSKMLGFAPEELVGSSGSELVHPDDLPTFIEAIMSQLDSDAEASPVRYRARHKAGGWRLLEGVTTNLLDDPSIRGFVTNARDITRRVEAEEALRRSDERFRALVQQSQDLIVVLDDQGKVDYVSPAGQRIFGRSPEETRGVDGTSLLHPDDLEQAMTLLADVMSEPGRVGQLEVRVAHADGSFRVVDAIGQNRMDDPSVRGIVLNIRDMTERVEAETELHAVQERFRALVQNATDVVTVVDADARIDYVSPSIEHVLGYAPDELVGTDALALVHPEDQARLFEASAEAVESGEAVSVQYRAVAKDGSIRYFEGITNDLTAEPSVGGFVTNARDISDGYEAEREAARLTEVLERSNEVVVISDPTGQIVYANQRAKQFLGIAQDHHVGELSSLESRERLRDEIMPLVRTHGLWNGELTFRTVKGDEVPMVATVQAHREHGEIVLISTIAHDITDLKRAQNRLEYEANHDALTGLPNRSMLQEVGEQALGRAARQDAATGVLFLDLDGFKEINDTLGHDAGDRVLIELGRSLRVGVRAGDLVARLGGDEFCILCEGVENEQELLELGQRMCDVVSIPMRVHGREVQVGTSVGVAIDRGGKETIGGLIRNADVALYRAKHAGGRRVELFDPALEQASEVSLDEQASD